MDEQRSEKTETSKKKRTVVVTGFGVFRSYSSNPSWEAVSRLQPIDQSRSPGIELVKIQVPVVYEAAEREVARIWEQYQPELVVHCGVSCRATCLTLEKRAVENLERYCSPDVNACKPLDELKNNNSNNSSAESQPHLKYFCTELDVEKVAQRVNERLAAGHLSIGACVSTRAGEYVCEYIYRCSLRRNAARTLFVHVPEVVEGGLSAEEIARGLQVVIEAVLQELQVPNFIE